MDQTYTAVELHAAFTVMLEDGGNFIEKLAALWFAADSDNQQKILATWPEYVEDYYAIARDTNRM